MSQFKGSTLPNFTLQLRGGVTEVLPEGKEKAFHLCPELCVRGLL